MVQKPKSRRSKPTRKPVTIDLEAKEVESAPDTDKTVPEAEPVGFGEADAAQDRPATAAEATEDAAGRTDTASGMDALARDAVEGGEQPSAAGDETVAPAPTPSSKGGSGLTWLGGGVIGGVTALLLAGGLQWAGVLPSMRAAEPVDLTPLQGRIDELAAEVQALQGAAPAVPDEILSRIDDATAAASANSESVAALEADLSAFDDQLAALNQAVSSGDAGEGAGLEALSQRADTMEQSLGGLAARIDGLETAGTGGGDAGEALRGELDSIAQTASAASESVEALRADVATMGQAMDEARSRIDTLAGRLEKVESDIEAGAGSRVAGAIAASALKSAADRGAGFMSELEAYAAVSSDEDTVASLRDYAASGVPTVPQLTERYPAVANRIVSASRGIGEDTGIIDRLSASARSLVQVRPVGEVEGDEPGAVAARMEVALQAGDLAAVIALWETLPEAAREASSAFMADVRARRELDTLIARVLSGAIAPAEAGEGESGSTEAGTGE